MALVETYRSRGRVRKGAIHRDAVRVFECPNAESLGHENSLWFQLHPTLTMGVYTPVCTNIDVKENYDPNRRPGYSRIVANYRTLRQPGKADISVVAGFGSKKVDMDLDGLPLIGSIRTETEPNRIGRYKTNGPAYRLKPKRRIKWTAAFDNRLGVNALNIMVGKVNEYTVPRMFYAPAGTLWITEMSIAHVWTGYDLWYIDVYFDENPDGWNNEIKRNYEVTIPVRSPVYEFASDGKTFTLVTDEQNVTKLETTRGYMEKVNGVWTHQQPEDEDTRLLKEASFSIFNDLLDEW